MTEEMRQIIREEIQAAMRPPTPICGVPILRDTRCRLERGHKGLHDDLEGSWRCPWCQNEGLQGHDKDCPAHEAEAHLAQERNQQ